MIFFDALSFCEFFFANLFLSLVLDDFSIEVSSCLIMFRTTSYRDIYPSSLKNYDELSPNTNSVSFFDEKILGGSRPIKSRKPCDCATRRQSYIAICLLVIQHIVTTR